MRRIKNAFVTFGGVPGLSSAHLTITERRCSFAIPMHAVIHHHDGATVYCFFLKQVFLVGSTGVLGNKALKTTGASAQLQTLGHKNG